MNDRRFIELLNLYVDQELSEVEARELEQEIAHRPERRQVYSQYCRMQRACVTLFEQQNAPVPRVTELAEAAHNPPAAAPAIRIFDAPLQPARSHGSRSLWPVFAWSGGALAATAAVVTVLLVRQPAVGPVAPTPAVALVETAPVAAPIALAEAASTPAKTADSYQPIFRVNLRATNGDPFSSNAPSLAMEQSDLQWLQQLKLAPMRRTPIEFIQFDSRSTFDTTTPAFVSDRTDGAATELNAFQFTR
ncbi:MAG TPA: hypothetical protein VHF69_09640 [Candidatus Synoicihabitans sp.]|nr:hypothetical protein [Candidatus Synoicihabitans sp.]